MTDIAERLTKVERDQSHPNLKPRDAATLILVDRSGAAPKVLLGKRHAGLKFMAGKFVFPGGRMEPGDRKMPVASDLDPHAGRAADARRAPPEPRQGARAGARGDPRDLRGDRPAARQARRRPCRRCRRARGRLSPTPRSCPISRELHFIVRAITPPRRPRRFDARFFAADASAIAHRIDGKVGPDSELVELVWLPIAGGQEPGPADHHAGGARRAGSPRREGFRPRPALAVLSDAAQEVRPGDCEAAEPIS